MALRFSDTELAKRPLPTTEKDIFVVAHNRAKYDEYMTLLRAANDAQEAVDNAAKDAAKAAKDGKPAGDSADKEALDEASQETAKTFALTLFRDWFCDKDGNPPSPDEVTEDAILALGPDVMRRYANLLSETMQNLGKQSGPRETTQATSTHGSTRRGKRQRR